MIAVLLCCLFCYDISFDLIPIRVMIDRGEHTNSLNSRINRTTNVEDGLENSNESEPTENTN